LRARVPAGVGRDAVTEGLGLGGEAGAALGVGCGDATGVAVGTGAAADRLEWSSPQAVTVARTARASAGSDRRLDNTRRA
jgi:hypothetical protein